MKLFYRRKGFTLLELMIVVIVIGILASVALPRFIGAAKKARESEAISMLGAIRASQLRYYLEHGEYHSDSDLVEDGSELDLDITPSDNYTYGALAPVASDNAVIGRAIADTDSGLSGYEIQQDGDIDPYSPE